MLYSFRGYSLGIISGEVRNSKPNATLIRFWSYQMTVNVFGKLSKVLSDVFV